MVETVRSSGRGDERRYFYVFCGDEVIRVRGVAEGGGDVEGRGHIC